MAVIVHTRKHFKIFVFSGTIRIDLKNILKGGKKSQDQIISIETKEVEATIVDVNYKPSYETYILAGDAIVPITHSAQYDTYLEYEE